ncbi:MAG: DUF1302 family protein [Burkholderiales bacterium]|nr:DUF1302 family protein [Burkholderiales bacterium]MDE1925853.1 DUF1302 family protein [Burkholderiales bacterium]MDE2503064.1 DUF1302 family protein [Burkholderiales bacterium]
MTRYRCFLASLPAALCCTHAAAVPFHEGIWTGSIDSQITMGTAFRTQSPSAGLSGDPTSVSGANTGAWSAGDNGNLNYHKGQAFSGYLKFTTELLAHDRADGLDFMARGTAFYDPLAQKTDRTQLSSGAQDQVVRNAQLLDLWAGKRFESGSQVWRARLGNQVLNWGESVFLYGGINATSAIDYQKALIPGTQIKEYVLPAPMLTLSGMLGNGWSVEGYYQFFWNKNRYPPIGSFWSTADYFGRGVADAVTFDVNNFNATGIDAATIARLSGATGRLSTAMLAQINAAILSGAYANDPTHPILGAGALGDKDPGNKPQFGFSLHDKPTGFEGEFGLYYLHYTDKSPVFSMIGTPSVSAGIDYQASYRTGRDLFGASTNFALGDWAIGAELSYRPRDAVALSGCFTPGQPLNANTNLSPVASGDCPLFVDKPKSELHLTGQLSLTPTGEPFVMGILKAESATLTTEWVATYYGGIKPIMTQNVEGATVAQVPDAGGIAWLDSNGVLRGVGTPLSSGMVTDFNWTYDGSVIPGWQLTLGGTYSRALGGYTPNPAASYLRGAQSVNLYVLLNQNPSIWQLGFNLTRFFGGAFVGAQPYADRGNFGAFVTYNF